MICINLQPTKVCSKCQKEISISNFSQHTNKFCIDRYIQPPLKEICSGK